MTRALNVPVGESLLLELATTRKPLGMASTPPAYHVLRETYFDTTDGSLERQRMTLCLRSEARGRQVVELSVVESMNLSGIVERTSFETPVVDGGLYATLAGSSEVATRVRAVVDPDALRPRLALDLDRESRELRTGFFGRASHRLVLDEIVAHAPGFTRGFQELTLAEIGSGRTRLETLAARLRDRHGLENDGMNTYERIRTLLDEGSGGGPGPDVAHDVRVALITIHGWNVALVDSPSGLGLPSMRGSGEDMARKLLASVSDEDVEEATELDLVGFSTPRVGGADLEVWLHESPRFAEGRPSGFVWLPLLELLERIGGPRLRDPGLIAALLLVVRAEIGLRLLREAPLRRGPPRELPVARRDTSGGAGDDDFLDLDLSILDFNQRVLEMAEDPAVPLLERFKFLSIFSSNMDEFFVVRVARLKDEVGRGASDAYEDLSPAQLLDLTSIRVRALLARQQGCLRQSLLPALTEHGVRIRRWIELEPDQRSDLTRRFTEEIFPLLTPLRLSSSSVRSFPRLVSLGLSLAAVLHRPGEGRTELGYVAIPGDLPRFLSVPDAADVIPVEEVIGANARELFSAEVQDVHAFRASRMADVEVDEDSSGSLLAAMADEVSERPYKPIIRLEVESTMPREVRAYLLKEIRAEQGADASMLGRTDVYEADGPLDLRCMAELSDADAEDGLYAPFVASDPLADEASVFEALAEGDLLVHHPFHDFEKTVGRFLAEAASDPDVVAIKLTLYRTGRRSPVMEALLQALASGKDVSVFVELKARFDEESNIEWTRRLQEAGAHVVTGVPGYKTHAKTALVVRREERGVRRYVHVGTGNYNAQTARFYTDLGLMSADPDLGADLNDFFNELTSSELPPAKQFRRILVAPNSLVQGIQRMIAREVEHAVAGRTARIQAKMNGLADRAVVEALYAAAQAGVEVDLVVRSICTLRPGVPGLSDGIRVRSILGRLLEHSRIFYFQNAGQSEYYIGSADWRARNLRRRVEVVAPVDDPAGRAVLRAVLDAQIGDPRAWVLRPDGVFERMTGAGPTSQEQFIAAAGNPRGALR